MQIILLEKVVNVGDLGEVVKVKQGYARNYLIPQGRRSAPRRRTSSCSRQSAPSSKRSPPQRLATAQEQAAKIEGTADQGRAEGRRRRAALRLGDERRHRRRAEAQGVTIEKGAIRMPEGPLKHSRRFPARRRLCTST